jgi:16S rRNA processing protein RimM
VTVGVVGRPHGVRGEVVIEVRTDEPDRRFAAGQVLRAEDTTRTFRVVSSRPHGDRLLVRFAELGDRTAAEQARGIRLVADVDAAERPSGPEEYFDRQLVGLGVLAADGNPVGSVRAVLHLPEQDLLEIDSAAGVRLVPFVTALVPEIDLAAGRLRLADVPGLLGDS